MPARRARTAHLECGLVQIAPEFEQDVVTREHIKHASQFVAKQTLTTLFDLIAEMVGKAIPTNALIATPTNIVDLSFANP